MNTAEKIDYIVEWLKSQLKLSDMKGFVIGVSGGIDSALTSTLCAKTEMPTLAVVLPINAGLNNKSNDRAHIHLNELRKTYDNVETDAIYLDGVYNKFYELFSDKNTTEMALVNSKARLRMTTLYQLSAARGYLVVGTGNKVEDFGIGFYSKYGDGGVDISPIVDLYKSEVYELARELGISEDILNATPTDGLWLDDRSDEQQIGATYDELEDIMKNINDFNKLRDLTDRGKRVLQIYSKHRNKNMHKMLPIPVCKFPEEK